MQINFDDGQFQKKNLHVFNFTILLKSRKFDARKIYMFYNMLHAFNINLKKIRVLKTIIGMYT